MIYQYLLTVSSFYYLTQNMFISYTFLNKSIFIEPKIVI